MKKYFYLILILGIFLSCQNSGNDDPDPAPVIINLSDEFRVCNNIITDCRNGNGSYCLIGFKWGATNPLAAAGEVEGPKESSDTLTYSFQEENGLVNTHAQVNLPSRSFSNLPICAKDQFRKALASWSAVSNVDFEEMEENSESDIRIFLADIRQSGIGYPNFPDEPCNIMGGNLIIQTNLWTTDCEVMYKFFLHEIGHVLGLGHAEIS